LHIARQPIVVLFFANAYLSRLPTTANMTATDKLCLGMAMVYSFFGITLAISFRDFWGPNSPGFTYWTVGDDAAQWFGRALGIWMTTATTSPYWAGMPKDVLVKMYLPMNILFLGMFIQASFFLDTSGPAPTNYLPFNMWWTQLPIAVAFLYLNFLAVGEGKKSKAT
jgi:hypothetical protein